VAKTIGAGHDGRANIRLARPPIAFRAKRAGANSHVPVLRQSRLAPRLAPRCSASRDGAGSSLNTAIRGLHLGWLRLRAQKSARKIPRASDPYRELFFRKKQDVRSGIPAL